MSMTLTREDIVRLASRVETAQVYAHSIRKLTEEFPDMTLEDAYAVQTELRRNFEKTGHKVIGWKAGLTSKPKMIQMGVDKPGVGFLTDKMARPENSVITVSDLVHPRAECEIAFMLKSELKGPNCTREDVLAATDYVIPAIEIIDSRFTGFKFDFESVIADNSSSARFVAGGRPMSVEDLDLPTIGVVIEQNGEIVAMGAAAEVLGDPAAAVAFMVNVIHEMGETVPAGSFMMSGAITAAQAVKPGDNVIARFQHLGSVSVRFSD